MEQQTATAARLHTQSSRRISIAFLTGEDDGRSAMPSPRCASTNYSGPIHDEDADDDDDDEDDDHNAFDPSSTSSSGHYSGGGGMHSPRPHRQPRPSYSEEQKFYIMYARIKCERPWPEIEDRFAAVFGQRSKGGLTSVYYRIRKSWGLEEVMKSSHTCKLDKDAVDRRASHFSREFLTNIGYLPAPSA